MTRRTTDQGIDRRDFGRLTLGTLGVAALGSPSAAAAPQIAPGIKLCVQSSANPSDEQLLFLKQLGAGYVSVGSTPELRTAEGFMQIKKRYADAGITVWNIGNTSVHNMPEVTLNLPGRDQKIEEYKQYLRNLGKAGIGYTTYAHMGNGIWTSGRSPMSAERRRASSIRTARTRAATGTARSSPARSRTAASSRRTRSGRTTPTSSSRSRRWPRRRASASASTRTIRRCRCSPACRAASSATSRATSARWRSPTARTSGSACAAAPGSKAARS